MKPMSKLFASLALSLAFVAPAHAFDVQYDYPDQNEIQTRSVEPTHQFKSFVPMMAEMPRIAEVIHFATGSVKLDAVAKGQAKKIAEWLKMPEFSGRHVIVNGYADSAGKPAANQKLSFHRAHAVVKALVAEGIPAHQLAAEGFGAASPVATNSTAEGRAENRRVTFTVLCAPMAPMMGHPMHGMHHVHHHHHHMHNAKSADKP